MNRIIFFFCCLFIFHIQADANEGLETSKITIRFKNQPLTSVLSQLEQQSGFRFFYQDKIADKPVKMNRKFINKTISEIFDVLLAKTNYSYAVFDKRKIVVIYKEVDCLPKIRREQESVPFSTTGTVVDEKGNAIQGASVCIKGEDIKTSTITNKNGNFTIATNTLDSYIIVQ